MLGPSAARVLALLCVLATAASGLLGCASAPEEGDDEGGAVTEGALGKSSKAPVYLAQAVLAPSDPTALYNKLTVVPSVVARGAKVTGPGLFGIVCRNEESSDSCTLNWLQRRDEALTQFFFEGPVAKSIALALPEKDRTFESDGVKLRCDVEKGGMFSSDTYRCAFSGLAPKVQEVKGSIAITPTTSLTEDEARSSADKYFAKL